MTTNTLFTEKVLLGKVDGLNTYLAEPSWDCDWYWGFGYVQNRDMHTHCDSIQSMERTNMWDAMKSFFDEGTLTLSEKDLWTFCELVQTFYTLKKTAELYLRGGANYTTNPLRDVLKNEAKYGRINKVLLPQVFDEIYKLFKA